MAEYAQAKTAQQAAAAKLKTDHNGNAKFTFDIPE
jgi:hypothetical protein